MKKLTITIETTNEAFQPDPWFEVARILADLTERIERNGGAPFTLRDLNGNTVGKVKAA